MIKNKYTYVLRTCTEGMTSYDGFKWPREGKVSCKDWSKEPKCGNGLHGLLMGHGDGSLLKWDTNAKWLVVKVLTKDIVAIDQDKVKFPKGTVVYCGDRKGATDYIIAHGAEASKVVGAFITVGNGAMGQGYHYSTVSGGDWSTVNGGDWSTVSGGDYSTVNGGEGSTVSGGYRAIVSGGDRATVNGGDYSTVNGGYGSTVSGGIGSTLQAKWSDGYRWRIATAYVGENSIEANVKYKVNNQGKFVKV